MFDLFKKRIVAGQVLCGADSDANSSTTAIVETRSEASIKSPRSSPIQFVPRFGGSFSQIPLCEKTLSEKDLMAEIEGLKESNRELRVKLRRRELDLKMANDEIKKAQQVLFESEQLFRSMLPAKELAKEKGREMYCQTEKQTNDSLEYVRNLLMKFLVADKRELKYVVKALEVILELNEAECDVLRRSVVRLRPEK